MTLKMFVTIIIVHICEWAVIVGHETENSDLNCDLDTANKYSRENNRWEEYLDNIKKASNDYVACNVEAIPRLTPILILTHKAKAHNLYCSCSSSCLCVSINIGVSLRISWRQSPG